MTIGLVDIDGNAVEVGMARVLCEALAMQL